MDDAFWTASGFEPSGNGQVVPHCREPADRILLLEYAIGFGVCCCIVLCLCVVLIIIVYDEDDLIVDIAP